MPDAATNVTICPLQNTAPSVWDALPYVYLLRVPLLTFLALLTFPFIALWLAPNLLRGVFEVTPLGMVFVTLGAALASWTVMITAWQVFLYGPERFHIRPFPIRASALLQLPSRSSAAMHITADSIVTARIEAIIFTFIGILPSWSSAARH